ncbi:MAG: hypothetical protein U9Q06_01735 [Nanoarchaeota archaeon]|nr:hypothetical protein [Nanoarchaeota archaeon]
MKSKLIIIPGAKALSSKNKYIQRTISFVYKYFFNFIPKYNIRNPWIDVFPKSKYEVIELKWSGKIIPYDVLKTSRKLQELLDSNLNTKYIFLTESIGTEIALLAIEKSKAKNVKKIIAICPVNKPRNIKDFSIISLKSKNDIFARFSKKLLWPLHFFKFTNGNVEELSLKNIRHDQFVPNHKIEKNQTLLELVENKIDSL